MIETMRALVTLFLTLLLAFPANAQSLNIVRDAEIESVLNHWCAPMYKAAGLNPNAVKIVMFQDDDLNAFTAGGQTIFVSTGLLLKAERPDEIVGVMAHETGHIVGGDVLMAKEAARNASYQSIVGFILGAGAGALTGSSQLGSAISVFGRAGAMGGFLAHSRLEESSADQAALTYLQQSGSPTRGLATFLEKLQDQELLPPSQQQGYARTHPISRDRVQALETRLNNDKNRLPPRDDALLARVQAKLMAFTRPSQAAARFGHDDSPTGLMARAITAYRQNRIGESMKAVDGWIALEPQNPYAYELKGQILKDGGKPHEAIPVYKKALELAPQAALIRIDAAHAILEGKGNTDEAIAFLNTALRNEPRSSFAHRLLATAWGQKDMEPEAQIHLAEIALLNGDRTRARELMAIAWPKLLPKSPVRQRAADLKLQLDSLPPED